MRGLVSDPGALVMTIFVREMTQERLGATDSRQLSVPGDNAAQRSVGLIIFISVSIPWIFHKQRYRNFLICPQPSQSPVSPINNLKVSKVTQ